MGNMPFTPMGNTVVFTANTTAPTPVQVSGFGPGANQYRIIIPQGSNTVFLGFGTTAAAATSNAVVVTSTSFTMPILPGTDEILTFLPNAYFTGITSSGSTSVYITPGDGV